jgi:hypothetical protein
MMTLGRHISTICSLDARLLIQINCRKISVRVASARPKRKGRPCERPQVSIQRKKRHLKC